MRITLGIEKYNKTEGVASISHCTNCRHEAQQMLCRTIYQPHIYYIPIFKYTKQYGTMCASCGVISKMNSKEYKQLRQTIKDRNASV